MKEFPPLPAHSIELAQCTCFSHTMAVLGSSSVRPAYSAMASGFRDERMSDECHKVAIHQVRLLAAGKHTRTSFETAYRAVYEASLCGYSDRIGRARNLRDAIARAAVAVFRSQDVLPWPVDFEVRLERIRDMCMYLDRQWLEKLGAHESVVACIRRSWQAVVDQFTANERRLDALLSAARVEDLPAELRSRILLLSMR